MRAILLLVALLLIPFAAARPSLVEVDYDVRTPNEDCPDCLGASASVVQEEPENCADCAYFWASASVQKDGDGVTVSSEVCRGGFVVICLVDQEHTVPV